MARPISLLPALLMKRAAICASEPNTNSSSNATNTKAPAVAPNDRRQPPLAVRP